jgi:DNA-binding NarL/FixJ family response regulator
MGLNVVVVESDTRVARSLSSYFHSVLMARSGDELRERVAKNRPEAVILDMEQSRLSDIRNLRHDFPSLPIVCTHRVPDEELWLAALEAGANDVCSTNDVQGVVASVLRNAIQSRHAVA